MAHHHTANKQRGAPSNSGAGSLLFLSRFPVSLLLTLLAGTALGLDAAILAQLSQGYPLWGLPGDLLGTLLVALPWVSWLLGVSAVALGRHGTRSRRMQLLAQAAIFGASAAGAGMLLGFTLFGRYEWFMRDGP
jgi:hypothetical protein